MNIYKFTHIETGRVYIGQTTQEPNRRRLEHLSDSRHTKRTHRFHNALRKYGEDAFTFDVISAASNLDELNLLETKYIKEYNSIENGFNIRNGGDNKTHNQESIEKMRLAQKAAHARRREANDGVETMNKKSGYKFSKPHPKKGKPSTKWSEEAKLRFSKNRQEYYKNRNIV
jgi:group I intron endonuclease